MSLSKQEYLSGLPFPSPGDLPHPGIEPGSPALQAGSLPLEPLGKLVEASRLTLNPTKLSCYPRQVMLRFLWCFLPGLVQPGE